jgi:hypothetical protein
VINSVLSICRGRRSKKLLSEKDYFVRNQKRMQYDLVAAAGLPIGRRSYGKRYKKSSEFTIKRSFNLLAERECGGYVAASIILQIRALEYVGIC